MQPSLEDTLAFVLAAHRGQVDRYGQPYIFHVLRVTTIVQRDGAPPEAIYAALLHDVVEDTPITLEDLRGMGYSEVVVAAVDCLTRRDDESYAESIERAATNPVARRVKLADLSDNMDVRRVTRFLPEDAERFQRYRDAWQRLINDRLTP